MIYSATEELYQQAAAQLCQVIGTANYYSGTFEFVFGAVVCRFKTSVIVYRNHVVLPEGEGDPIADLVPVWWEFHTCVQGEECINDFSFSEMRLFI